MEFLKRFDQCWCIAAFVVILMTIHLIFFVQPKIEEREMMTTTPSTQTKVQGDPTYTRPFQKQPSFGPEVGRSGGSPTSQDSAQSEVTVDPLIFEEPYDDGSDYDAATYGGYPRLSYDRDDTEYLL